MLLTLRSADKRTAVDVDAALGDSPSTEAAADAKGTSVEPNQIDPLVRTPSNRAIECELG